jgi:putative transposase
MPRGARVVLPDIALHLVQRGINRGPCFFSERHYADYLELLACFAKQFGCSIHAYCLMTNHVHLLLTPHHRGACARVMKQLNQCYVQRLNKSAGRTGTLWEGRFHSGLVASDGYALACYRYIELNPVRAGIVAYPGDYRWSSYRSNAEGAFDSLLSAHATYAALSESPERRGFAYRAMFDYGLQETEMQEIRKATRGGYRIGERRRPRGRPPRQKKEGTSPFKGVVLKR